MALRLLLVVMLFSAPMSGMSVVGLGSGGRGAPLPLQCVLRHQVDRIPVNTVVDEHLSTTSWTHFRKDLVLEAAHRGTEDGAEGHNGSRGTGH